MYHGYGYAPYGPYPSGSPVPSVGHDGQSYATQQYQYPQYYQPPTPTNPTHGVNGPNSQSALPHSVASHQARIVVDTTKIGANGSATGMLNHSNSAIPRKQNHLNGSVASNGSYGRGTVQGGGSSASSYSHNGLRSPVQWYDGPIYSNGHQRQTTSSTSYHPNTSSAKSHSQRPTTNLMVRSVS
jgi:YTH domain-containing family protein